VRVFVEPEADRVLGFHLRVLHAGEFMQVSGTANKEC
jgi:hypothetical protein